MWPRRCSDVALRPTGERWRVEHDAAGLEQLVAALAALAPARVVLEATGGLELELVAALAAAALPVVVVNPRQTREFARATGTLAKTDALDAAVLAHFAEAVRPTAASAQRRPDPGPARAARAASPAGRDAGRRRPAADSRRRRGAARDRGPHRLAGAAAERARGRAPPGRCSRVPSGASVTSCCAACRASASSSH